MRKVCPPLSPSSAAAVLSAPVELKATAVMTKDAGKRYAVVDDAERSGGGGGGSASGRRRRRRRVSRRRGGDGLPNPRRPRRRGRELPAAAARRPRRP